MSFRWATPAVVHDSYPYSRFVSVYYSVTNPGAVAPSMEQQFKPGELVPVSGIYRVEHKSHRLMHEATLLAKSRFPLCRKCDTAVRFELVRIVTERVLPFRSSAILEEFNRPILLEKRNRTA